MNFPKKPRSIELAKLTKEELKNLLENNQRHNESEMVQTILKEMTKRGLATGADYSCLKWNPEYVNEVMLPFKEIASTVPFNKRTAYTQAGGLKIGRAKDDPARMWIDTYSAIKTQKINAVFVCYIKQPGNDPEFQLHIDGVQKKSYNASDLPDALLEWKNIASQAVL